MTLLNASLTFDQMSSTLLAEAHRREHRTFQLGDEEALATTFNKQASLAQNGHYSQFQGRFFRGGPRGVPSRGFPARGFPRRVPQYTTRSSLVCYNCGKPGHFARDFRHARNIPFVQNSGEPVYANVAELYDVALTEQYSYPNYYGHGPWYMDSGAIGHVALEPHKLDPGSTSSVQIQEVRTGSGESHSVHGVGTATINTSYGEIKLIDVKYVPTMKKNLISVGRVTDSGHLILFSNTSCWILDKFNPDHIIATGHRDMSNGLYRFGSSLQNSFLQANTVEEIDVTNLWHRRFGHLNFPSLSHLETKQRVIGLPKISLEHRVCACCLVGRQHR
jgi:hypothetical protein